MFKGVLRRGRGGGAKKGRGGGRGGGGEGEFYFVVQNAYFMTNSRVFQDGN